MNVATKDLKKARAFFSPMTTAPKMIRVLDKLYEKVRTYNIGIDENLFDYSIVLGVHSQLNVMPEYLWNKFLVSVGKNDESIAKRVHLENEFIASRFNDTIIKATKQRAFIGLEISEQGREGSIQGAAQASLDIQKRVDEKEIEVSRRFNVFWPFKLSEKKSYLMLLYMIDVLGR
ncbi:MAG: hypothetical protein J6A94_05145 [Lachnospiraceae bacterium]|nr:hypothetical protein [Lachnospiraceae bacterium]